MERTAIPRWSMLIFCEPVMDNRVGIAAARGDFAAGLGELGRRNAVQEPVAQHFAKASGPDVGLAVAAAFEIETVIFAGGGEHLANAFALGGNGGDNARGPALPALGQIDRSLEFALEFFGH